MRLLLFAALLLFIPQLASAQIAPGAIMWLRADSGVVASPSRVTLWRDVSGRGNDARQSVDDQQPRVMLDATTSRSIVRFDGAQHMVGASVFPTNRDYTLTFAVRINNFGATNNIVSGTSHAHWLGSNAYPKVLHNGNFNTQCISSIPLRQNFNIVTMSYLESRQRAAIYVNGIFADSATTGSNPDSTMYLGAFQQGNFLIGDLAEVVLYDRELSDANRTSTESYLFTKYGIARGIPLPPRDTTFDMIPAQLQFVERDGIDSGRVYIAGHFRVSGFDSIYVRINRNGAPWHRFAEKLTYSDGAAPFSFAPRLHAELSEYRIVVGVTSSTSDSVIAIRDSIVCGDAFLINGQSNSIFGGTVSTHEYVRTFGNNYSPSPRDTMWSVARADGSGGGPHIGAWGMRFAQLMVSATDVPICIINGGVGGTTIEQHQRNDANPLDLSTIYGSMLYRVQKAGIRAKALLWYQGESNTIDGYYAGFKALHDDWLSDYVNVQRYYVVQIRPGCAAGEHRALRELQRTLPDSLADVAAFSVMGVPEHDGCHYTVVGYDTIGTQLFNLLARDFYETPNSEDVASPDIVKAFFTSHAKTEIAVVFDNAINGLELTPDVEIGGALRRIANAFFLDDTLNDWQSARVSGDTVYLSLGRSVDATTVSYIPSTYYPGTSVVYEGPWVRNRRGVGAFSFFRVPIEDANPTVSIDHEASTRARVVAYPNPFSGSTTVSVTLAASQVVNVTVYDGLGRRVFAREIDGVSGVNEIEIDGAELGAGIYTCAISALNGTECVQLVAIQ